MNLLAAVTIPSKPRKIEVGSGYLIQINPIGPRFVNRNKIEVQKFAVNLWLRDGGILIWHLACLGDFVVPPTWTDTEMLKMAVKWLLIPTEVWDKKGRRVVASHREWLGDIQMVNEFKITVAYTLMGKAVRGDCEFRFRRNQRKSGTRAISNQVDVAGDARKTEIAIPVPYRAAIPGVPSAVPAGVIQPSPVQQLQTEAVRHGDLMSALSTLKDSQSG